MYLVACVVICNSLVIFSGDGQKTLELLQVRQRCHDIYIHLDTIPAFDGQTDGIAKTRLATANRTARQHSC